MSDSKQQSQKLPTSNNNADSYQRNLQQGKRHLDNIHKGNPFLHSIDIPSKDIPSAENAQKKQQDMINEEDQQPNLKRQRSEGEEDVIPEQQNRSDQQAELAQQKKGGRMIGGCHCQKSKCLKHYCECYAQSRKCTEQCKCTGCENQGEGDKRYRVVELDEEKGCSCRKSNCLKKYCECYNSGAKCSTICKCQECKNSLDAQSEDRQEDMRQSKEIKQEKYEVVQSNKEEVKIRSQQQNDQLYAKLEQILKNIPQAHQQAALSLLEYWLS